MRKGLIRQNFEYQNFAKLLDDVFNKNFFYPYYCYKRNSHEEKKMQDLFLRLEEIIGEAMKDFSDTRKNLVYCRYAINGVKRVKTTQLADKYYNSDYSKYVYEMNQVINLLAGNEKIIKVRQMFFTRQGRINKEDFKGIFSDEFLNLYVEFFGSKKPNDNTDYLLSEFFDVYIETYKVKENVNKNLNSKC